MMYLTHCSRLPFQIRTVLCTDPEGTWIYVLGDLEGDMQAPATQTELQERTTVPESGTLV
jgi:hypothetical protein